MRDPLQPGPVFVDDVEVEVAAVLGVGQIGSEDDALAIGQEIRSKIGGAVVCDLALVLAISIHDPYFQVAGADQSARQKFFVVGNFLGRLGMLGAVDDLLAVVRPERTAIVTQLVRELFHVAAVSIHGVDIDVGVARGRENDFLAVARDGGFRIVAWRIGQAVQITAVRLGGVNVIGVVNRPDVALGIVGLGRALRAGGVRGRKKNAVARGKEIAAGGASFAGTH